MVWYIWFWFWFRFWFHIRNHSKRRAIWLKWAVNQIKTYSTHSDLNRYPRDQTLHSNNRKATKCFPEKVLKWLQDKHLFFSFRNELKKSHHHRSTVETWHEAWLRCVPMNWCKNMFVFLGTPSEIMNIVLSLVRGNQTLRSGVSVTFVRRLLQVKDKL